MSYFIGAITVLVIVVLLMVRKSRYYGRIFNDEHYAEIAGWASNVIDRHPLEESSFDNGTAFLTSGGLALAYTSVNDEGYRSIHFSVSQHGGYTTAAVGGRILFLLIRLLHKNKCESSIFRTESTVHHAVFSMPTDRTWEVESVEEVVGDMATYQHLSVETVNVTQ